MAEVPSILGIGPDCFAEVLTFLKLDDRLLLAATCSQCRENEETGASNVESRQARIDQLLIAAETWLESTDVDVDTLCDHEDRDAFLAIVRELDGAGIFGVQGLLHLMPLVAPRCCVYSPILSQRKKALRSDSEKLLRPVFRRWLPTLDAGDLARDARVAAEMLVFTGPHSLDAKLVLDRFRTNRVPTASDFACCQRECEFIFLLGMLGRAAIPHLPILLRKLMPVHTEEEEDAFFEVEIPYSGEDSWYTWTMNMLDEDDDDDCNTVISRVAMNSLTMLRPFMNDSDLMFVMNTLSQHISTARPVVGGDLRSITAIAALSKLDVGHIVRGHCVVEKVIQQCSSSDFDYVDAAVCRLIGAYGLAEHLGYLLNALDAENPRVTDAAADALCAMLPLLDRSQHSRMAQEAARIASKCDSGDQENEWAEYAMKNAMDLTNRLMKFYEDMGEKEFLATYFKAVSNDEDAKDSKGESDDESGDVSL